MAKRKDRLAGKTTPFIRAGESRPSDDLPPELEEPPCDHADSVARADGSGYHDCDCGATLWGKHKHVVNKHLGEPHYAKCDVCGGETCVTQQLPRGVLPDLRSSGHACEACGNRRCETCNEMTAVEGFDARCRTCACASDEDKTTER